MLQTPQLDLVLELCAGLRRRSDEPHTYETLFELANQVEKAVLEEFPYDIPRKKQVAIAAFDDRCQRYEAKITITKMREAINLADKKIKEADMKNYVELGARGMDYRIALEDAKGALEQVIGRKRKVEEIRDCVKERV